MKIDRETVIRLRDTLLGQNAGTTPDGPSVFEGLNRAGSWSPEETALLGRVDPMTEAMFLMMAVDGSVADEELRVVSVALGALSSDGLGPETVQRLLQSYGERLRGEGWEARLQAVAEALPQASGEAELAYALAAAIALADGDVALEENDLLDRFSTVLGLSDDRCCALLDLVKNQLTGSAS